jgi:GrpB-like predicted nucleotidyltransferase (UPF0157 family)
VRSRLATEEGIDSPPSIEPRFDPSAIQAIEDLSQVFCGHQRHRSLSSLPVPTSRRTAARGLFRPYDPNAPERFRVESRLIRGLMPLPVVIEHVGSTSVPDLPGKPTVDLLIGVPSLDLPGAVFEAMARAGYEYRPEKSAPDRHTFAKGRSYPRDFIAHAVLHDGPKWREMLLFRDHLRAHPDDARRYAEVKRLAARDRDRYLATKEPLILELLARARR